MGNYRNLVENTKECCASCKLRKIKSVEGRVCGNSDEPVAGGGLCEKWALHPKLEKVAWGLGKVKKLRYLNYFRETWLQQQQDYIDGKISVVQLKSIEDIRKEFEERYGPIYLKM